MKVTAQKPEEACVPSLPPAVCHTCGLPLDPARTGGLCGACLFNDALGAEFVSTAEPVGRFGGHELLCEIARGGMGIVYRARQREPERIVALKSLLGAGLSSPEARERFRLEARAMAALDHPAILPVFAFGEEDRVPFFTMKLADGGSLAQRRAEFAGKWRAIAELVAAIGDAVQFAHERGVLHRDLKPGNILFDESGRAYVADFGLAKLAGAEGDLTRTVSLLGTPNYLAPEIALRDAHAATTASDVWALGAILYELLAQRPPFEAESVPAVLSKIAEEEPAALPARSSVERPALNEAQRSRMGRTSNIEYPPRDLEVIARKALAKDRARRYPSARELADDLRRWIEGRTILARPASAAQRVRSWARRKPGLAAMCALLALALVVFVPALWISNRRLVAALTASDAAQGREREHLRSSLLAQARAQLASRRPGQRFDTLAALREAAAIRPGADLRDAATTALALPDFRPSVPWAALVPAIERDMTVFDRELRCYAHPLAEGGFAIAAAPGGEVLRTFPDAGHGPAYDFRWSADGRFVAAKYRRGHAVVWSVESGESILALDAGPKAGISVDFDPRGAQIAVTDGAGGVLLQSLAGDEPRRLPVEAPAYSPCFDLAGSRLAVRRKRAVEVWSADDGTRVWAHAFEHDPWEIAWSADGARLAVAMRPTGVIHLLDARDGRELAVLRGHDDLPNHLAFHPAGRWLVSLAWDRTLRVWDTFRGAEALVAPAMPRALQFSADGSRLAYAPDAASLAVAEWAPDDVFRSFAPGGTSEPSPFMITASPDCALLATTGSEGAHVWDVARASELRFVPLENHAWTSANFVEQGRALVLAAGDAGMHRLDEPRGATPLRRLGECDGFHLHTILPDSAWVMERLDPHEAQLWPGGDRARAITVARGHRFTGILVSADRRWAVSNLWPTGDVRIWDVTQATSDRTLGLGRNAEIHSTPDSRALLTGSSADYRVWVPGSWKTVASWPAEIPGRTSGVIGMSSGGRWIATLHGTATFSVRDTAEWRERLRLEPPFAFAAAQAHLSADGDRLWILARGHRVHEWRLDVLRSELAQAGLDR